MTSARRQSLDASLTTLLVEVIAEHRGSDPNDPAFCLYEDTDPEALERLLERTEGPVTVRFRAGDAEVAVERTGGGDVTVDVESVAQSRRASD